MTVNMTIQNADNALVSALKSVCKLHPEANMVYKIITTKRFDKEYAKSSADDRKLAKNHQSIGK